MAFGDDNFESLLPPYLTQPDKARLKDALKQFMPDYRGGEIDYSDFYKDYRNTYFMQSDLIREIRFPYWDIEVSGYDKKYTDAIVISNTCDISFDNVREMNNKQCLFAPIVELDEFINDFKDSGIDSKKADGFKENIKQQLITNIFYLPVHFREEKEYIALLDKVFWFPSAELNSYIDDIEDERIASLTHYGYYLFILKLSFHLCRLPEQCDREVDFN